MEDMSVKEVLTEGNNRFVNSNLTEALYSPNERSNPVAVVIGCMDTRVPPEVIFDQGVGRLFVLRIAGNIITDDLAYSAMLACKLTGISDIIVLGHTRCAAIQSVISGSPEKAYPAFLESIAQALKGYTESSDDFTLSSINAKASVKMLKNSRAFKVTDSSNISIHTAIYDVRSGKVDFLPGTE